MAAPALLFALAALTLFYFVVGLILYISSIKRGYEGITAAGRTLAQTAVLPAIAAAGSILLLQFLPPTLTTTLRPLGLVVIVACALAPPLLALASELHTRKRTGPPP